MQIEVQISGVKLGIVEASSVIVASSPAALVEEINATCERLRKRFTLDSLAQDDSIVSVRAMFRRWGVDASKYRPSSEALLRRVVQGKGLYFVSNIVDVSNLGSVETGWPYGVYNREKIAPPVCLRLGTSGEKYEGIGRRVWHLEGRPVLADTLGAFGAPISDSTRTQVDAEAAEILTVIYASESASDAGLMQAMERQAERLRTFCAAQGVSFALHGTR